MNAQFRKAAKNVVAGDLIVIGAQLFEARGNADVFKELNKVGRFGGRQIARVPARLAHNGKGRLRNLEFDANRQVYLAQVGDVFIAA